MYTYKLLTASLLAAVALAAGHNNLLPRQSSSCEDHSGYKTCLDGCIPLDYTCCAGGGGCEPGYYCTSDGCCPDGEFCNGGGGTVTGTLTNTQTNIQTETPTSRPTAPPSSTCEDHTGYKTCLDGCIPLDYTCCPGGGGCERGYYCTSDGCCPDGEFCNGGGGTITGTLTSTQTGSPTSRPTVSTSRSTTRSGTASSSGPGVPLSTGGASNLNAGLGAVAGLIAGAALL
ncbi:hypothetical protein CNMCM6106_005316 [Aspergillus hiratsukae]|uniref:GPI anchored serine-threonine rich protein n=1 Tax=Aspergillus hiratsukae TaxID=1194566 RepID=A0A8H6QD24_9EURO|nr:hypothetical protein CNMCM6106_005316 [Aspergillus hiratsukae]